MFALSLRVASIFHSSPPAAFSLCITYSLSGGRILVLLGPSREDWRHQVGIGFYSKMFPSGREITLQPIILSTSSCSSIPVQLSMQGENSSFFTTELSGKTLMR